MYNLSGHIKSLFCCHFCSMSYRIVPASTCDETFSHACWFCSNCLPHYKGGSCLCWERIKTSQQSIAFLVSQRAAHTPLKIENGFFQEQSLRAGFKLLKGPRYTAMEQWTDTEIEIGLGGSWGWPQGSSCIYATSLSSFHCPAEFSSFVPTGRTTSGCALTADSKQLEEQLLSTHIFRAAVVLCT